MAVQIAVQKNIALPHDQIAELCRKHHVRKLWLFGSVLRDDFTRESDIDVLVEFETQAPRLVVLLEMEAALEAIFRRKVDLGEYQSVLEDANYIRRRHILDSAQVIYEG